MLKAEAFALTAQKCCELSLSGYQVAPLDEAMFIYGDVANQLVFSIVTRTDILVSGHGLDKIKMATIMLICGVDMPYTANLLRHS